MSSVTQHTSGLICGVIGRADFERCGDIVNFGPCKRCGAPLLLVATVPAGHGPRRELIAACLRCDVVTEGGR
jgi:hypothetical protein